MLQRESGGEFSQIESTRSLDMESVYSVNALTSTQGNTYRCGVEVTAVEN